MFAHTLRTSGVSAASFAVGRPESTRTSCVTSADVVDGERLL